MEPTFANCMEPMPDSVENNTIVAEVTKLFALTEVKNELLRFLKFQNRRAFIGFQKLEEIIVKKISLNLRSEALNFLQPIALQLLKCFNPKEEEYHKLYNHSEPDGSLVWTANGTIDKIQTLKRRILEENEEKDYGFLFELACKYCYEEHMLELWKKLPTQYQRKLWNESVRGNYLTTYWMNQLRLKFPLYFRHLNESFFYFPIPGTGMKYCISAGNILALKYFWHVEYQDIDITHDLIGNVIPCSIFDNRTATVYHSKYPERNEYADILLFLLTHVRNHEQQRQNFETFYRFILKSLLLFWPWQKYFLSTITETWNYLDGNTFVEIMSLISSEKLLKDVWRSSPVYLKKYLIMRDSHDLFHIKKLLRAGEITIIQLIHDSFEGEIEKFALYVDIMTRIVNESNTQTESGTRLEEIWRTGSRCFRKCFVLHNLNSLNIMKSLLQKDNVETVIGLLDSVSAEEKEEIDNINVILTLIDTNRFDFVEKYMHWYFDSEVDLSNFKSQFISEQYMGLLNKLNQRNEEPYCIRRFFECFCYTGRKSLNDVCYKHATEALEKRHFEFATEILVGCNAKMEDIVQLKNEMMLTPAVIALFISFLQHPHNSNMLFKDDHWLEMKNFIKWFSPISERTADELKAKLDCRFCETVWPNVEDASEKLNLMYYLLDTFATDDFLEYNYIDDNDDDYVLHEENVDKD